MNHTLILDGTSFEIGLHRILTDIYLKLETGKINGLLGRNGEGKTSLMNIISGNIKPTASSLRIDDQPTKNLHARPEIILHLPQYNFIPKNLLVKNVFEDFSLDISDLINWFPNFNIDLRVGQLSGGFRRILEIFIVTYKQSLFAMLDEPFTHLNPLQIEKVNELLQYCKTNKAILISDHMYQHVLDIADNVNLLKGGKIYPITKITDLEELGYLMPSY